MADGPDRGTVYCTGSDPTQPALSGGTDVPPPGKSAEPEPGVAIPAETGDPGRVVSDEPSFGSGHDQAGQANGGDHQENEIGEFISRTVLEKDSVFFEG
jgi:hypothetical protein